MSICTDCGNETAGGLRCKRCHGEFVRRQSLEETAATDRDVLRMVAEGLTGQRLAARLGISKTRASEKVRDARRRESERKALAAP